ncbi:MAG: sensor histidine kinase [Alphaproteobacteria bacterium]|nr:sensor histidine kinase [Alphaproteobacteria bacterium]
MDEKDHINLLKQALAVSADAFIIFDSEKRIFFVSDHYRRVYPQNADFLTPGASVYEVFDRMAEETGVAVEDPRYKHAKDFWYDLKGQIEFPLENGRYLRVTASPLPDGQGTIVSTTDITEYKKQERALAAKQRELERALEKEQEATAVQKQFISMVSHEFRTPLAIIDGNAQLMERRPDELSGETVLKRTKAIRGAVSRLLQMVDGVLSANSLQTGMLKPVLQQFDIAALIGLLCEEQRMVHEALELALEIKLADDEVVWDRKLITIILSNLLSNAVKYAPESPKVNVSCYEQDGHIHIVVADNGIGIPEHEIPYIFEKFYRATSAASIPGTGLGLSLTQELVNLLGGTIQVHSKFGQGSSFAVLLPREVRIKDDNNSAG